MRASVIVNNEKKTCLASCPSSCDESHGNVIPPKGQCSRKRRTSADDNRQFQSIVLKFPRNFFTFYFSIFLSFFLSFIHVAFSVTYWAKELPFLWASNRHDGKNQHNKRQRANTVRRLLICIPPSPYPIIQLFLRINIWISLTRWPQRVACHILLLEPDRMFHQYCWISDL